MSDEHFYNTLNSIARPLTLQYTTIVMRRTPNMNIQTVIQLFKTPLEVKCNINYYSFRMRSIYHMEASSSSAVMAAAFGSSSARSWAETSSMAEFSWAIFSVSLLRVLCSKQTQVKLIIFVNRNHSTYKIPIDSGCNSPKNLCSTSFSF